MGVAFLNQLQFRVVGLAHLVDVDYTNKLCINAILYFLLVTSNEPPGCLVFLDGLMDERLFTSCKKFKENPGEK